MASSQKPASFKDISEALTGVSDLGNDLSEEYMQLVTSGVGAAAVDALLAAASGIDLGNPGQVQSRIMDDAQLGPLAQAVIVLWYTGAFQAPGASAPTTVKAEHHFSALIWPAVGAHPLGLSGGYFGYWAYPAED